MDLLFVYGWFLDFELDLVFYEYDLVFGWEVFGDIIVIKKNILLVFGIDCVRYGMCFVLFVYLYVLLRLWL